MGIMEQLKAEAKGYKSKNKRAQNLEEIFNRMFYLPKDIDKETEFIRHVMTRGQETGERKGLHASAIIKDDDAFCMRQQVLSLIYKQSQGEDTSVGLKRIFEEGNAIHEKWQRLFLRAGYSDVKDLDTTMYNAHYGLQYSPDIICRIPEFLVNDIEGGSRMVGEIKSVNSMQFVKMERHPTAYKQLQLYMWLTGIWNGFVLCENKNTQEIKVEYYRYDVDVVRPYMARLNAIKANYEKVYKECKLVKRPRDAVSPDCNRCSECPMKCACWGVGMGAVKLDEDDGEWDE